MGKKVRVLDCCDEETLPKPSFSLNVSPCGNYIISINHNYLIAIQNNLYNKRTCLDTQPISHYRLFLTVEIDHF